MLVLGLGLGNEGQVLGLGLGFGLVLGMKFQGQGLFQGLLKCKSVEKIEVTIKAQVLVLCPLTFKFVTCTPVSYTHLTLPTKRIV